jgi:hypothetical protein
VRDARCAASRTSPFEPVFDIAKRKLENGEQRLAGQNLGSDPKT